MRRWHLDEAVRQVGGMSFDASTRSESPQLRLRSSLAQAKKHLDITLVLESVLIKKRWRCPFDPTFESGKRRKARGAPLFNDEDLHDVNPLTDPVACDTLLQGESLSEGCS